MASSPKLVKLIHNLVERTERGSAMWTPGSYEDTFLWSSRSGSVAVFPVDHDGQPPWAIRIMDSKGQTLEEEPFRLGDPAFEVAARLYQVARGNALDIDGTIDKLLDDLDDLG